MSASILKRYFHFYQLPWLLLSFLILLCDQLTKYWASHVLMLYKTRPVIPFLNLTLAHNKGAAFSMLAHAGNRGVGFLTVFAAAMSLFLLAWLLHLSKRQSWLSIALTFILGGALGNLLDRILYGYVIDFIDMYVGTWHWPAFNMADSAICIGIVMLLYETLSSSNST